MPGERGSEVGRGGGVVGERNGDKTTTKEREGRGESKVDGGDGVIGKREREIGERES